MVKFCNIKEGLEVEGKYKGVQTLFITMKHHMESGDKYDPGTVIEEMYSSSLYPAVYLLDKMVTVNADDLNEIINIINIFLKDSMVSYEVNGKDAVRMFFLEDNIETHENPFNYIYNMRILEHTKFMDKGGKIQTFVKFQNTKEVFVQQINPYSMIRNLRSDEKNDIHLL